MALSKSVLKETLFRSCISDGVNRAFWTSKKDNRIFDIT